MKVTTAFFTLLFSFALSFAGTAQAENISNSSQRVCQKIKSCGVAQLEEQGLQPEMVEMMKGMFDGMCESMVAPYIGRANDAGLEDKGIACLDAIETMSCEQLMSGAGNETEACKELEQAADEAGLNDNS